MAEGEVHLVPFMLSDSVLSLDTLFILMIEFITAQDLRRFDLFVSSRVW